MRYALYAADGTQIGEAETAQKLCDQVKTRSVSIDSEPGMVWPYTVWEPTGYGWLGQPYRTRDEAFRAVLLPVRN